MSISAGQSTETEFAIVGGGVVGLSVAWGLLGLGKRVAVFDEGDDALRASRGNFGLVWVQGKGRKQPAYARWTRRSAANWSGFAAEVERESGTSLSLVQDGGYTFFTDEQRLYERVAEYETLKWQLGGDYPFEILGHNALRKEEPHIGRKVAGAILHNDDGHVNPLMLLRSLAIGVRKKGASVALPTRVLSVLPDANGFVLKTSNGETRARRVVLCAGLGTVGFASQLGFKAPIRAQRGQVLITEKLPQLINRPSDVIRQVDEGGVQIGASAEEVGPDDRETTEITAQLARSAIELFPHLQQVNLIRSWAALRIMSPDGLPVYQQSSSCPGAFYVTCHSGITLAAAHAQLLPLWLTGDRDAPDLSAFSEDRFSV